MKAPIDPRTVIPGWGTWPNTVYDAASDGLRTTGVLEPPGPFVLHGAVYVALVLAALWFAVGPPDEIASRWAALAFGVVDDHTKAWTALGMLAASVPVYLWVWFPLMLRLLGSRFNVLVTQHEVRVRRLLRADIVYSRRDPLEIAARQHRKFEQGGWSWGGEGYQGAFEVILDRNQERTVIAEAVKRHQEYARSLALRLQTIIYNYDVVYARFTGRPLPATTGMPQPDDEIY